MTRSMTRRGFVAAAAVGAAGSLGVGFEAPLACARGSAGASSGALPPRKFYKVLSLGRIGFHGSFKQSVDLALKYGFEGVDPDPGYFATLSDDQMKKLLDDLASKHLKFGAAGLPVEFRKDEGAFGDDLARLPDVARQLERAGVWRVSTWVMPCSNDLTYLQNFRTHAVRLRACARILSDHGQRLGLEYVGPRTLWRSQRQPFVHTMSEIKELLVAIGLDNLGLQLDSWHWYNAEETKADLLALRSQDVLTVDLNDAPAGVPRDQLVDDHRELPAATGVIPVKDFLGALAQIGYDGPIQAEPFNAVLKAMPIEQACAATAAAVRKAFDEAGLS